MARSYLNRMSRSLNERVLSQIKDRDQDAEVRISLAQLALVVFFAALYVAAPKAEGGGAFNITPYALSAYGTFTLVRLLLAVRRLLNPAFLVLSIFADVVFLIGLIYSFHIQYGEPTSFSLKSPSFLYIFIFIALRALRFDPTYVLITGAAFLAGWGWLVWYSVWMDPDFPGITRNYVAYVNGMEILIGAELDKMISVVAVTLLLAYASVSARGLLGTAVRDEAAVANLSRFFAPDVATSLRGGGEDELKAGMGVSREVSVLTVDIRGFTPLSANMQPGEVTKLLTCYQRHVVPAIQENGGAIDKFLGDGILATFGAYHTGEAHAANSLRAVEAILDCAKDMNQELREWGLEDGISIGVAACSGNVTVGIIGSQDRLEHTVIGNAVNTAAKLEAANKHLGTAVLCTARHYDMAILQGYQPTKKVTRLKDQAVTGMKHAVDLVSLEA